MAPVLVEVVETVDSPSKRRFGLCFSEEIVGVKSVLRGVERKEKERDENKPLIGFIEAHQTMWIGLGAQVPEPLDAMLSLLILGLFTISTDLDRIQEWPDRSLLEIPTLPTHSVKDCFDISQRPQML